MARPHKSLFPELHNNIASPILQEQMIPLNGPGLRLVNLLIKDMLRRVQISHHHRRHDRAQRDVVPVQLVGSVVYVPVLVVKFAVVELEDRSGWEVVASGLQ